VINTKTHKKHINKKIAHHVSVHEEKDGHLEVKGKVPKLKLHENVTVWKIATLILAIFLILSIFSHGFSDINIDIHMNKNVSDKGNNDIGVANKLPVELYVMSQCPYGVQAEDTMFAAIQEIGEENFDLTVEYIVTDLGEGQFNSLHGEPEALGDKVQLCARDVDETKYLDLVLCMNKEPSTIPNNWEACAESLEYDVEAVRTCYEGSQGNELLSASAAITSARGATGSPTIYLNNTKYNGGREVLDFKRAFCQAFDGETPESCADIPEAVKVNLLVLNDNRCADCQIAQANIAGQLTSVFPDLQIETIDYMTTEGKALYETIGGGSLPVLLFNDDVQKAAGYSNIAQYLVPAGEYTSLLIGASFDPVAEICDNNIDDTGNGKVDCADTSCVNNMVCRETIDNQLQVFIMSDCPYGRKAVEALKGVRDNFATKDLDFEIHYIAGEQEDGFSSLHGQYEVDEDIVQLCVQKHNPDVWFDYMYCRSTNSIKDIDWKICANQFNINIEAVQTCFDDGEGADLLREDIKIAQSLGIGASPTWLANNKYTFGGIDAETVKTNFCQYNQDTTGCENTLSANTDGMASGSC